MPAGEFGKSTIIQCSLTFGVGLSYSSISMLPADGLSPAWTSVPLTVCFSFPRQTSSLRTADSNNASAICACTEVYHARKGSSENTALCTSYPTQAQRQGGLLFSPSMPHLKHPFSLACTTTVFTSQSTSSRASKSRCLLMRVLHVPCLRTPSRQTRPRCLPLCGCAPPPTTR